MLSRDLSSLADILQAAKLAYSFITGVEKHDFLQDMMRQSAIIRQLEVLGEATKRLSPTFRAQYPTIPWQSMAGMRDILIHAYDHVDLFQVWQTVTVAIPDLITQIEPLVND